MECSFEVLYFEIFQLALKCSKYQSTWDTGTCLADNESVFFARCMCVSTFPINFDKAVLNIPPLNVRYLSCVNNLISCQLFDGMHFISKKPFGLAELSVPSSI